MLLLVQVLYWFWHFGHSTVTSSGGIVMCNLSGDALVMGQMSAVLRAHE